MFADKSSKHVLRLLWALAFLMTLISGCATPTTTTLETTMHSSEESLRFQSFDVTARVQMELNR